LTKYIRNQRFTNSSGTWVWKRCNLDIVAPKA